MTELEQKHRGRWLTDDQVARILGLASASSVQNLRHRGKMAPSARIGKHRYTLPEELDRWIEEQFERGDAA